jgi:hypothetical protein
VKSSVETTTHRQMIRDYPVVNLVEGWYFRVHEISVGCYNVAGKNTHDRTVSRLVFDNPDHILTACVKYAREVSKTH